MTSNLRDGLLKPADVCRLLSVSRTWVYAAAADGRIPSIRLGGPAGPLRFARADLERWLEEVCTERPAGRQRADGAA